VFCVQRALLKGCPSRSNFQKRGEIDKLIKLFARSLTCNLCGVTYEGWNFNSGNYLFTTDTK